MDKIIFATGNEHKMIEIRAILSDLGVEILSQKEAGIKADVIEDGMTFEENAMIKATEIAKIAHEMPEYAHAVVRMILRIRPFWTVWTVCRMKSVQQDSSVRLQQLCRMVAVK